MKDKCYRVLIILILMFVFAFMFSPQAQAQTPQDIFNQYISDLQKNPNDNALREKIIKHVQTMKPAPAIPEKARKHMDRGIAAIESAKTTEDFQDAAVEFMKAVTAAPWHANGYRNLAIAQDKAGQYDVALKNIQLYLLTMPSSSDEAWAKTLINKIEYRKEKAARPEIIEKSFEGRWHDTRLNADLIIRRYGTSWDIHYDGDREAVYDNIRVERTIMKYRWTWDNHRAASQVRNWTLTLSDDRQRIEATCIHQTGDLQPHTFTNILEKRD